MTQHPERKEFIRRKDLLPITRLYIAFQAYTYKGVEWGKISELARQYWISRTFVYMLLDTLVQNIPVIFGPIDSPTNVIEEKLSYRYILSLRLEGRCSIQAISTMMKRFKVDQSATGTISQVLQHIGSLLPNTISKNNSELQLVVFLSDEIFSKSVPILVTVEPISSAILRIEMVDNRKAEGWKKHWQCIKENGYGAAYLVCDEGKALCTAQKEALSEIKRQPDTYHAIAHQLGMWVDILENEAYKAIEKEDHCEGLIYSAASERVIDKRNEAYNQARKIADEKIELYENFRFIYRSLISNLDFFDDGGNPRDRKTSEENIKAALDLLETLGVERITKAVKKARNTMPALLNYFDVAESILAELNKLRIAPKALQAFCLAWQWRRKYVKAKKPKRRKYCTDNETFYTELAEGFLPQNTDVLWKEHIYSELDNIVQSSALVECINSIIRPYLNNSKNQVNREMLNLIMFYHNHRRYTDGKRKKKTPLEILTGKKQEKDWIELLFDFIERKNPVFFSSTNMQK